MMRGVARYARLFRPHPSLRANCLQFFFHHPGEGLENRYYGDSTRRFRPHPALACHLPHPGEGLENRYYGGSTRRFRPHPALACHLPHPGEGSCGDSVRHRDSADLSVRLRGRTKRIRTAERSLPPGGEGVAPATDEGETGERTHVRHPFNPACYFSIMLVNRRCTEQCGTAVDSLPLRGGRWREATDEGGRTMLTFLPPHRNSDTVSKHNGIAAGSLPPRVGKVSRQRRMRAKSASAPT